MRIDYKTYALPSVHHFNSSVNRRATNMAIQRRLGILPQRRFGLNFVNRVACCLTSLALAKRAQHATANIVGRIVEGSPRRLVNGLGCLPQRYTEYFAAEPRVSQILIRLYTEFRYTL